MTLTRTRHPATVLLAAWKQPKTVYRALSSSETTTSLQARHADFPRVHRIGLFLMRPGCPLIRGSACTLAFPAPAALSSLKLITDMDVASKQDACDHGR